MHRRPLNGVACLRSSKMLAALVMIMVGRGWNILWLKWVLDTGKVWESKFSSSPRVWLGRTEPVPSMAINPRNYCHLSHVRHTYQAHSFQTSHVCSCSCPLNMDTGWLGWLCPRLFPVKVHEKRVVIPAHPISMDSAHPRSLSQASIPPYSLHPYSLDENLSSPGLHIHSHCSCLPARQ